MTPQQRAWICFVASSVKIYIPEQKGDIQWSICPYFLAGPRNAWIHGFFNVENSPWINTSEYATGKWARYYTDLYKCSDWFIEYYKPSLHV